MLTFDFYVFIISHFFILLVILRMSYTQNEVDCAYFLRTGHCKFGGTCKFNHPQPQPTNMMVPTSGQQSYPWSRASFIASPRWQDPSSYASLIMPQGVVPVQGWNPYSVSLLNNIAYSLSDFV